MRKFSNIFFATLLAVSLGTGCGGRSRTVTTETVEYPGGGVRYADGTVRYPDGTVRYPDGKVVYPDGAVRYDEPIVEQRTETKESEEHHGIITDTFRFIGDVIAFPFRLVGDVFSAIF